MPDLLLNGVEQPWRALSAASPAQNAPALRVSRLLWSATAVGRWATAVALAGLTLLGAWYAVSGEPTWEQQRPYVSLAIAATIVAGVGGLSLLLAGRRRIGLRRLALLGEVGEARTTATDPVPDLGDKPQSDILVSADGRLRYHRADCPLAVGKGFDAHPAADHDEAGRRPCGVCLP